MSARDRVSLIRTVPGRSRTDSEMAANSAVIYAAAGGAGVAGAGATQRDAIAAMKCLRQRPVGTRERDRHGAPGKRRALAERGCLCAGDAAQIGQNIGYKRLAQT